MDNKGSPQEENKTKRGGKPIRSNDKEHQEVLQEISAKRRGGFKRQEEE